MNCGLSLKRLLSFLVMLCALAATMPSAIAQNQRTPVGDPDFARSLFTGAYDDASRYLDRLEAIGCITPEGYRQLEKEAQDVLADLDATYQRVRFAIAGDKTEFQRDLGDEPKLYADILKELARLKKNPCPPDAVFRTVGPTGQAVNPPLANPPPAPPAPPVKCKACEKLAAGIAELDARIAKLEREEASLRKAVNSPGVQKALQEDDARLASLRQQRAELEEQKRKCEDACKPKQTSWTGTYIGGELVKNSGWVHSTERLAATGLVTNQFSDSADPVGGGFLIGYRFAPLASNIVVSPFASFDFMNAPVNHTFIGGSYLGTTAKFMGTFGVKAGPQVGAGVWIYGIGGLSVMNETLNVNFIPISSSQSAWVAGGTAGVGGAWQPAFLQRFGHPVSLFAEYQHTWWQDANFNTPAASPFFNYTFARQDDVVKLGFTVDLSPAAPAPAGPRYVKALPAK
jgi:hypothetical protein